MFKKKYNHFMNCSNCQSEVIIKIPKGTKIKSFVSRKAARCSYCGCIMDEDKKEVE